MNDDDWAQHMLADLDLGIEPPSKVDLQLAVRRGRRQLWARRTAVTAAGTTAVVLVVAAFPAAVPGGGVDTPATEPAAIAPSGGESKPITPPARCEREPLDLPDGTTAGSVRATDPSGRFAVGVAYRDGGGTDMVGPGTDRLVLWDGRRPVVLDPPRSGLLRGIAVNAAGTVAVSVKTESATHSWTYRAGVFTELPALGGGYAALGINAGGDVVGAWLDGAGVHPPVIWPAGSPGNPRTLAGGDPGDGFVAAVGGIDDDGTVVGTVRSWESRFLDGSGSLPPPPPSSLRSRPVYWPAGLGPARELPMPDGFGPDGWVSGVRGGVAVGDVARPNPDVDRRGNRAAVWDLRGGTVALDDRLSNADDVNAHGWMVGRSSEEPPARTVAVFAGSVVYLPMPAVGPDSGGAAGISDDGRVIAGSVRVGDRMTPVRWICT